VLLGGLGINDPWLVWCVMGSSRGVWVCGMADHVWCERGWGGDHKHSIA
jgi:hypothetical protein